MTEQKEAAIQAPTSEEAFRDGLLAQLAEEFALAERCYRFVLAAEPQNHPVLQHLATVLVAQGRGAEAVELLSRSVQLAPDAAGLWLALGGALHKLARYPEAIAACERTLALRSPDAQADNLLGVALLALDRPADAALRFRAAIDAAPDEAEAHANLGAALLALGRATDAKRCCETALDLKPANILAMRNLGVALLALDREEEAVVWFRRAVELAPGEVEIHYNLGIALARLGSLPEAVMSFDRAIELRPCVPRFHRARGKFGVEASQLAALETMVPAVADLPVAERIELYFALGKAYGDLGRHALAARHWIDGNALKRRGVAYDETATLALLERIRREFTPDLMRRRTGCGHPSSRPVFIVGMPRSGSSLVEQILASHPRIVGAGEIDDFPDMAASLAESSDAPFPELMRSVTGAQLRDLGAGYERRDETGALRVTDKLLANFALVGLIHLTLPNARIIHVRRDPLDNCLSCFAELFAGAQDFSYDLGELGRYHRVYRRLMDHWREILPDGIMLDIDYEAIVADTEAEARRMVAHLGLDWDDACLAFHRTARPVRTASMMQVRQPIHRGSIGRSAPYVAYLRPLLDALAGGPE